MRIDSIRGSGNHSFVDHLEVDGIRRISYDDFGVRAAGVPERVG